MVTAPLHTIEPIVTPDQFEYGVHRMRVDGGWFYWLQPVGGACVSSFIPDSAPAVVAEAAAEAVSV
jgi:hypothetical protein